MPDPDPLLASPDKSPLREAGDPWNNSKRRNLRSRVRNRNNHDNRNNYIGLRVVGGGQRRLQPHDPV